MKAAEIYERGSGRPWESDEPSNFLSAVEELSGRIRRGSSPLQARSHCIRVERRISRVGRARRCKWLRVNCPWLWTAQRPLYEKAVDRRCTGGGSAELEGQAWHSLGDHAFTAAFTKTRSPPSCARKRFSVGTRTALGTVYNSIGRVYRAHGRVDEALKSQHKALALHERATRRSS